MLNDCSPAWVTQPPKICSTSEGSIPDRLINSTCAAPSNSAGCTPESAPLRLPIGVRTASTITGCAMVRSLRISRLLSNGESRVPGFRVPWDGARGLTWPKGSTMDFDLEGVLISDDDVVARARYTSAEFSALEFDRLWSRVWQVACREE